MANLKGEELDRIKKTIAKTISFFSDRKLAEIKNVKYYFGEQWSEDEKAEREDAGKPTLTFNHIKRFVNWLYGTIKQMNLEIRAVPQSLIGENTARVVTGLIRYTLLTQRNKNNIDLAVLDGFIRGVGFVQVTPYFEEDPNGEIIIKRLDPLDVYYDTLSEAHDLTDARYIFYIERLTIDEIMDRYPNKAREINESGLVDWSLRDQLFLKQEETLITEEFLTYLNALIETAFGKMYNVIHYRERYYAEELAIYNERTNSYINIPGVKKEEDLALYIDELNRRAGEKIFKLETTKVKRYKIITLAGNVVLEHYENPFGTIYFDIVPFFCYKLGRHYQGFVDDLIDPQDEFNWRKSLFTEILNEMPIDSFFIPKGSVTDIEIEDMQDRLKQRKQLIPIRYEYGQPIPIVSDALQKLAALVQYEQLLRIDLKEIGGMVDALTGVVPRKLQSGRAIQALQQWGFVPFSAIFSNYYYFMYIIANVIWKLSKYVYAGKKSIKILSEAGAMPEIIDINIETEYGTLNQLLMDEYEVTLVPVAYGADDMSEKLLELIQLRQLGVPIPDEYLIMFSKVPFKSDLIRYIQELRTQIAQQQNTEGE